MSETAAKRLGGENALAAAGLKKKPAPPDKNVAEDSAAAFSARSAGPRLQGANSNEPVASRDAPPRPEDAASRGATPHTSEIELKLLVDADRLADFNNAPVIIAHARNKGTRKHLKATYYDTPERTLWRNKLSFRVRQTGARFVQTVKAEQKDDPLRRGEWEAAVPSMAPDIALAMPFIPAKLHSDLEAQELKLEPVFTTEIRRHRRILDLPSGTVEVAFDEGVLKAGDRSMPVSEIELELKSGSVSAVYDLALRLAEYGPVKPSIRSKSARV
jgi:triphosphatase